MTYAEFIAGKHHRADLAGKEVRDTHPMLKPFQRDVVKWACRKGRAAVFLDTGLGKTFIQLEWARLLGERTLIVAPLSVARQTVREARKIGLDVRYVRNQAEIDDDHLLYITNYEMVDHFELSWFGAVVLDESSILKAIDGKTRRKLIGLCRDVPYKLACTATPAPNDRSEIGNHAEWLGICTTAEMLAQFFIHANKQQHRVMLDGSTVTTKLGNDHGQEWRLKGHARTEFYRWMSSWAMSMRKPSDLGYDDNGYVLPPLTVTPHWVDAEFTPDDQLFFTSLEGIRGRKQVRRATIGDRVAELAESVNANEDQWIVWAGMNDEAAAATAALHGAIEVRGSDEPERKAEVFEAFQDGKHRVLVTKGRIGGFGMNFQQSHRMAFLGLDDSWEMYYQCIRRQLRFGQTRPVDVHIVLTNMEAEIYENIIRKERMASEMVDELISHVRGFEQSEIHGSELGSGYMTADMRGRDWTAMLGDSCERLKEIGESSIDLSVYSPPFADLYTYSPSERDLGNSRGWDEFFVHYGFIIREVLRVTKPGRLSCVHVSDIPAMSVKDGYIGMKDFPGRVIAAHEADGWTFVGRAFVQKDPQAQAIRTKSKALLFVQLRKDSADSRPAIADQILIFRKPGDNAVPVRPVENREMDNETWIEWAHGIWVGIRESDVLKYRDARDADDEKHICPLQLGTIERCIKLYSNPGETVLTPFMGIGSEAYQAIRLGRKAVGIELKPSYFEIAVKNLDVAERERDAGEGLFAGISA